MSTISATAVSDWPTPTVSTMHRVEPGRLAEQDRLAGAARDAAGLPPAEDGRMKARRRARQLGHARLVAEDRAAAALRAGIDRQHRDAPAARDAVEAEALDKGRFAGAGRAGDADAGCAPPVCGSSASISASASAR